MGLTIIAPEGTYTAPAKLITKEITENGTYSAADDSANGFSSVTVNVEGGGGSSDFSTVELTVVNTKTGMLNFANITIANIQNADEITPYDHAAAAIMVPADTTEVHSIILYKGYAIGTVVNGTITNYTGDIEVDGTDITITGDCTITIS